MYPEKGVVHLDVARPLPFPAASLRYVFSEHLIEHLPYATGIRLLAEIHRVLADGGKIRIATPDMAFLVRLYHEPNREYIEWAAQFSSFRPPTAVHNINNFFRASGHQFIWDFPTLQSALESAGFSSVTRCQPGESDDPVLRGIEMHGKAIGDQWNKLETFVVEATKLPGLAAGNDH